MLGHLAVVGAVMFLAAAGVLEGMCMGDMNSALE